MTETEARQFFHHYFNAAMNEPIDVYLALLADDVILEDPVGTPPLRGREAIRQFLTAGRAMIERADFEVRDVIVCGTESAVRWSTRVQTKRGAQIDFEGIGVFTFDDQHKLRQIREFYDATKVGAVLSGEA